MDAEFAARAFGSNPLARWSRVRTAGSHPLRMSAVVLRAIRVRRKLPTFLHNSYMKWKLAIPWAAYTLQAAIAFSASGIHIANRDTSITLEAYPGSQVVSGLTQAGCQPWTGQSPEELANHVEVGSRIENITWRMNAALTQVTPTSVRFVYEASHPHLRLYWEWRARAAHGPVEHSIRIQNLDSQEIWLPMQDSLRFAWQVPEGEHLEHLWIEKGAGGPSPEGVHRNTILDGYKWTGESSPYAHPAEGQQREMIPYALIERTDGSRCGWYAGIEFSGRTRITIHRTGNLLTAVAGLNAEPGPFRTRVKPGDSFNPPTVFIGAFQGGADAAGNSLRRWIREVLNHRETIQSPTYPMVVNNSWGSGMQINEAQARNMIRDSAELGFEMFHLDAGWFRGVGDWYPDPKKFPHGLAPIADYAHELGLKFGLWMDWAQASLDQNPGSLYINDPKVRNWLIADPPPGWKQGDEFKGITIDLGVPAAHDRAASEVERVVKDYRVDMLEHDGYVVAQGCSRGDHPHAPPDAAHTRIYEDSGFLWADSSNETDVSYHATLGYYDVQSQLRKLYPNLLLEICNDGGRMVDFGSAAHGDYFSISDAYDPLSNRRAFYDASYVLPPAMLETYVQKWPTANLDNFRYVLRSGMMGWFTLMLDTTAWNREEHAAAREAIALYKARLRPLIREADLYHVSPRPDGIHWDGIEYFDAVRGKGVVFAFHGSSTEETKHTFVLQGLDPDRMYQLTLQDHSSQGRRISGNELMTQGVEVPLPVPDSSELVFLDAISK
jgi:Melibiase/Glycosyl hydrolase family 36 C-terminal domain